ncbi:MAG: sodium-dependent transporter [Gammaproteobacteria bacterium]|nr:sodium-dependent transporter [Gammaproteobacteria bacterium]MDH4314482.1 sodium-dependent transporter [Gammaproteobacteria bacterium]MDH5214327.1 sodium-dependent transporter [Gammaproteobacteria bacterium]MDH5500579.1 sodium-dependent transporter [Gammaproteobacteria bacterium]
MSATRGEFSSRIGFILAAAGSAVGLGNIWGFPTQAAGNGGGAFLLVYLLLAFCLAFPALMAELIIGRHAKANAVTALRGIANNDATRHVGAATGYLGITTASLILSFYAIVAGWMLAYTLAAAAEMAGMYSTSEWLTGFSLGRNLVFTGIFMFLTVAIICGGVKDGIEKWCTRLMPSLIGILVLLIVYVLTLDGAGEGVRAYLVPDFSRVTDPALILGAMGQAFFSMSLGVGTMLIYGSYVSDRENIVSLGRSVTLFDIGIAVLAGMLIIPAMYVAQHNGVQIYDAAGKLIAEDTLIFTVLPALFETMGGAGVFVAFAFFMLMLVAALTSSISMLEVPVAYAVENHDMNRKRATYLIGGAITLVSVLLIFNFGTLFGLTISITTRYSQPMLGLLMCVFAGWIWHRNTVIAEIRKGMPDGDRGLFWRIWPFYVRFVCPAAILAIFIQQLR